MRNSLRLGTLAAAAILCVVVFSAPVYAASSQKEYVSYELGVYLNGHTYTGSFNESVAPTSKAGLDLVSVALESAAFNISYSKVVNASAALLPVLPALSNQSLSFGSHGYAVNVSVEYTGSSTVHVLGGTYTLKNYTVGVEVQPQSGSMSLGVSGTVSVFQTGLVYQARLAFNSSVYVEATLKGTNIALTTPSDPPAYQGLTVAGAAAAVVVALGAALGFGRLRSRKPLPPSASYHVD